MENFVNLQPDLSINSLYFSTSQENNNYLIQKTSMKFENFTFPGEQKLPIDNIFYFQSPTNETRNSCMELMTTKCPELEFPKDLQQFSYNLTSVPSETENDFSLIVPLANHFSGEEMIEEDAQFLVGTFENEENDGIIDELLDFMFTAAQENFLRLTGMSYEEYQRRKDKSESCFFSKVPDGMMGFITRNTYDLDDDKWNLFNKNSDSTIKTNTKNKLSVGDQIIIAKLTLQKLIQQTLIQNDCKVRVNSKNIEYYQDNKWNICQMGECEKILYILFLCKAVEIGNSHKSKVKDGIRLSELRNDYTEELKIIASKFGSGIAQSANVANICKYPDTYIQKINETLGEIFARKTNHFIIESNIGNGISTYGIHLQWNNIDLGEFENLI